MNFEAPFETQESYVKESKAKIIWLSLAVIFIICGILMAIFHPEAEFTWLFEVTNYCIGLFIVAIFCIYAWMAQLGEHRDEKYYFTPDGKLDLSTPRYYSKLKRPKLLEFFNRGGLDEFAYDGEGNVQLISTKGKSITAPLSDLTVKYTMDKAARDAWRIYKMTVTTPSGAKIKFTTGSSLLPFPALTDAEYDDVHMILSTAGTLIESKTSKASKWANKINSAYSDLDFSGFFGKSDGKSADNKVIDFVKAKVGVNQKKKSWFKKAMEYFWGIVGIVYIAIVLIVNIAAIPEIFGGIEYDGGKGAKSESITTPYYDAEDGGDELSDFVDTYYLSGKIGGKYPIEMEIAVVNNYMATWARYRYTNGSGAWIDLELDTDEFGRTIMYESLNGERVARIETRLTCTENSIELRGWHTNLKTGKELVLYADGVRN